MDICKIKFDDFGGAPAYTHNFPCPVHYDKEHAVYFTNDGVFEPSWKAQQEGWKLVKLDTWFKRLVWRLFIRRSP